jgi:hypothetical protein
MIVVLVVIIFINQFVYGFFTAEPTIGQSFKYLYDADVSSTSDQDFASFIIEEMPFSYDVIEFGGEPLTDERDVLAMRIAIQDGDIFITSGKRDSDGVSLLEQRIDNQGMRLYNFNKLLFDAKTYLKGFLKDEFLTESEESKDLLVKDSKNLDEQKIHAHFLARKKKDNFYRKEEKKNEGKVLEVGRINQLVKEVNDFEYLLEEKPEIFYRYTRYSHSLKFVAEDKKAHYQTLVDREIADEKKCGENAPFGILAEKLTGGKEDPSKYFKLKGQEKEGEEETIYTAKDVVITAFDFLEYQSDLQFETISFMNSIVRKCSNFLDGR